MPKPVHSILMPVETINRELDFKLFLAVMTAHPSRRSYIGSVRRINRMIDWIDGGLYVGKHIFTHQDYFYKKLNEHNVRLIYLSEEGAIFVGDEDNWRRTLDRHYELDIRHLRPGNYLCNFGEFQSRYYAERVPYMRDYIRTVGHPRFDLYKVRYRAYFKEAAEGLRSRFGSFILVNTNRGKANNSHGIEATFHPSTGYLSKDRKRHELLIGLWAHDAKVLVSMVAMVHRLHMEFPQTAIVVRPHPSESIDFYRKVFAGIPNIHVEHEGPVAPWLMACELLIHDGCTTAIEAHLLDKPVINYRSEIDPRFDRKLPNQFGLDCCSESAVIDVVRRVIAGQGAADINPKPDNLASDLIFNLRNDSFPEFLAVMEESLKAVGPHRDKTTLGMIAAREWLERLRELPKKLASPFSARRHRHEAVRQKFYGFDAQDIAHRIRRVERLCDKKVSYRYFSDQLIVIESQ